jgi:hypothetical protein
LKGEADRLPLIYGVSASNGDVMDRREAGLQARLQLIHSAALKARSIGQYQKRARAARFGDRQSMRRFALREGGRCSEIPREPYRPRC